MHDQHLGTWKDAIRDTRLKRQGHGSSRGVGAHHEGAAGGAATKSICSTVTPRRTAANIKGQRRAHERAFDLKPPRCPLLPPVGTPQARSARRPTAAGQRAAQPPTRSRRRPPRESRPARRRARRRSPALGRQRRVKGTCRAAAAAWQSPTGARSVASSGLRGPLTPVQADHVFPFRCIVPTCRVFSLLLVALVSQGGNHFP